MGAKDTFFYSKKTLNIRGTLHDLSDPLVMGILNVTPDSFYDGGKYSGEKSILKRAEQILTEGGNWIDIGGYSSRPGAADISVEEEMNRVLDAIKLVMNEFPQAIISIDTFRSVVAQAAIEEGAIIVNDISAGELDNQMFDIIEKYRIPYIIMHMRGTPANMALNTDYNDILLEIIDYFQDKINKLQDRGISDIIVDPGFGFSKKIDQNYQLLKNLSLLEKSLNQPMLVGLSRKSMIYKSLNISSENALNGTTALNMMALTKGASILRVHDVKEAVEVVKLYKLTNN